MFPKDIKKMGDLLKTIVIIGIVLAVPSILLVPFLLSNNYSIIYSMLIVYPNGLLMIAIAYQFLKMFDSLKKNSETMGKTAEFKNEKRVNFKL